MKQMNVTNHEFRLIDVVKEFDRVRLVIELMADDKTCAVYLNNYLEGIYIGNVSEKYNVYMKIRNGRIEGELLYESIKGYAASSSKNTVRLWARNRIGNEYIDQAIVIGIEEINITFSHTEDYLFSQKSNLELCISYYKDSIKMDNPLTLRAISNLSVIIEKNNVVINDSVKDGLEGEMCLAWKSLKNNAVYYFHAATIDDHAIAYSLSTEEMNKIGRLRINDLSLEWIMADREGNQYKLYIDNGIRLEDSFLPVDDYCAQMYADKDGGLCINVKTSVFFCCAGTAFHGNGIRLEFPRRSYDLELMAVVAQRVNTDIEYQLPFEIVSENSKKKIYDVKLEFGINETEDSFRTGIYQFFVEIKEGYISQRYPLKLFRETPVNENTYLIFTPPYSVIGGHYYNCLFYIDSSNNLKCNILPKRMKLQLAAAVNDKESISIPYKIEKEVYFEKISGIRMVFENGEMHSISLCEKESVLDSEIYGCITIPLDWLYESGTNSILRPEICFDGREGSLPVENNFYRPAVNNRELCSFSFLNRLRDGVYRRIWGNHRNGSYMIGVTENAELFSLNGMWIYEDNILCIRIDWINNEYKDIYDDREIKLFLRDVINQKQTEFGREWAVKDEIIFHIPLSVLENKEFLIVGVLPDGILSYVENTSSVYTLLSYKESKKVALKRTYGSLQICVEQMPLYENVKKAAECQKIIKKAREKNKGRNRKIWLIGENYGLSARDNGLAFFEYCRKHSDSVDAEIYFVSKEANKDIAALQEYRDHVVIYDSAEHIYLDELAEFYIVSHGIRDVMPSLYHNAIDRYRKNVIYLQHGITAMKINGISNRSYGGSIRRFIVSSEQERRLLADHKQFWEDEIAVTGFSRYDKLSVDDQPEGKYIWIMPTWRDWLVQSEREFVNSDFYIYYGQILSAPALLENLRNARQKMIFSLHIEFEKYKSLFEKYENDVVHITDMHEKSIHERIMECSIIVTDYSSIAFDVIYLGKPAVFFQYDQEMYNKYRGSYVNLETDLPGEVIHNPEDMIDTLISVIKNGFAFDDKYKKCAGCYFDYHDSNNSERIYHAIIECREEIADEY